MVAITQGHSLRSLLSLLLARRMAASAAMSTAAFKRRERAREALLKAIVWALSCGISVQEIISMVNTKR